MYECVGAFVEAKIAVSWVALGSIEVLRDFHYPALRACGMTELLIPIYLMFKVAPEVLYSKLVFAASM